MMTLSLGTMAANLRRLGFNAHHKFERIGWEALIDLFNYGDRRRSGIGLATLHLVIARWGVNWTGYPGRVPGDPDGRAWSGVPQGSGKHYNHGAPDPFGNSTPGISIADLDSGSMRKLAARFGAPSGIPPEALRKLSWNQLLTRYPRATERWGLDIYNDGAIQGWIVDHWLTEYWHPVNGEQEGEQWFGEGFRLDRLGRESLALHFYGCAVNAGISNSANGIGKRVRGAPVEDQIAAIVAHKKERGARAVTRAQDRALRALRIAVLFRELWIAPIDGPPDKIAGDKRP